MGFPSVTAQVALGSAINGALCSAIMVSNPASPGATIFGPPLNPAKKCGSTNPVVMRMSASTQCEFSHMGKPPEVLPRCVRPSPSKAEWLTTR